MQFAWKRCIYWHRFKCWFNWCLIFSIVFFNVNRSVWKAIILGQFLSLVLCFMTLANHHINTAYQLSFPTGKSLMSLHEKSSSYDDITSRVNFFARNRTKSSTLHYDVSRIHNLDVLQRSRERPNFSYKSPWIQVLVGGTHWRRSVYAYNIRASIHQHRWHTGTC